MSRSSGGKKSGSLPAFRLKKGKKKTIRTPSFLRFCTEFRSDTFQRMKFLVASCRSHAGMGIKSLSERENAKKTWSSSSSSFDHLAPTSPVLSRRRAAAALLLSSSGGVATAALSLLFRPSPAEAAEAAAAAPKLSTSGKRGIAAYVRKRRLDPLSSYVPAVLAAREQLAGLEPALAAGSDPVETRIELRSGAFEGLRDNVRAVGEYATTAAAAESSGSGSGSGASKSSSSSENGSVAAFFEAVQKLDYELFAAAREKRDASPAAAEALRAGVAALDALLATVPAADLEEARRLVATAAGGKKKNESSSPSPSSSSAGTAGAAAGAVDDEKLRMVVPDAVAR